MVFPRAFEVVIKPGLEDYVYNINEIYHLHYKYNITNSRLSYISFVGRDWRE